MLNTNLLNSKDFWYGFQMKDIKDIQILCVDDEQEVLHALKRTLRKVPCQKEFVLSGEAALAIMAETHVDILISDMRMPEMSGAQLFAYVDNHSPDTYKVLLTGYSDLDSTIEAINQGSIDKYMQKPWQNDTLLSIVEEGIEQTKIKDEINNLLGFNEAQKQQLTSLNQGLEQTVEKRTRQIHIALKKIDEEYRAIHQLLFNLIRINPVLDEKFAKLVSRLSLKIAESLQQEDLKKGSLRLAGLLCEIGLIGLKQSLLEIPVESLKYEQLTTFKGQVEQADLLLGPAKHLDQVRDFVINQYEQLDGKGYPKGKEAQDIPLGSKILTVSRDYWRYVSGRQTGSPLPHEEALAALNKFKNTLYDADILDVLKSFGDISETSTLIKHLTSDQLEPGMILKENISSDSQFLLLAEGHVFCEESIDRLINAEKTQEKKYLLKVED